MIFKKEVCYMRLFDDELAAELAADPNVPPDHIEGIRCDVESCAYHDGERFCTADAVSIGMQLAATQSETCCRTFRRRAMGEHRDIMS